MLTDQQYQLAQDNNYPLLTPKGTTVWILSTSYRIFLDEEDETMFPLNVTFYIDENDIKRAMDTHTFKDVFSEVPDCKLPNSSLLNKQNINTCKTLRCLK